MPPAGFWAALTALCEEHGWLLCLDEVKTGFGRTGRLFAAELWDLQPDLMCLGKAMGGGVMPIGAVLGSDAVLGTFDDVSTGSTWAWLPASCAVALRTLECSGPRACWTTCARCTRSRSSVLAPLVDRYEQVGDVRVQGCFIGIELVTDKASQGRAADLQEALAAAVLARGSPGRLEHGQPQRPAVTGHGPGGAAFRARAGLRRRSTRCSAGRGPMSARSTTSSAPSSRAA